jgi:hypothetical protein
MVVVTTSKFGEPLAYIPQGSIIGRIYSQTRISLVRGGYAKLIITSLPNGVEPGTIGKCSATVY